MSLRTNMEHTIIILFLWYWIKEKVCLYGMWKERNIMISLSLIHIFVFQLVQFHAHLFFLLGRYVAEVCHQLINLSLIHI